MQRNCSGPSPVKHESQWKSLKTCWSQLKCHGCFSKCFYFAFAFVNTIGFTVGGTLLATRCTVHLCTARMHRSTNVKKKSSDLSSAVLDKTECYSWAFYFENVTKHRSSNVSSRRFSICGMTYKESPLQSSLTIPKSHSLLNHVKPGQKGGWKVHSWVHLFSQVITLKRLTGCEWEINTSWGAFISF